MQKPHVVVFAGVPGTSKTPVAHFLSCEFGLPILSTDQIRYEVREDLRLDNINQPGGVAEFERRWQERFNKLLTSQTSFIFDGSMDRQWAQRKQRLVNAGYDWFMINMELSRPFLVKLFTETGRSAWIKDHLDDYLEQHRQFLAQYQSDIHLQIDDSGFARRLALAAESFNKFLQSGM